MNINIDNSKYFIYWKYSYSKKIAGYKNDNTPVYQRRSVHCYIILDFIGL